MAASGTSGMIVICEALLSHLHRKQYLLTFSVRVHLLPGSKAVVSYSVSSYSFVFIFRMIIITSQEKLICVYAAAAAE